MYNSQPNQKENTMFILHLNSILFCILFFIYGCNNNSERVKLSYTNAQDEIYTTENLIFTFSHSVVADTLLGDWDSTNYIDFEPAIPGNFKWAESDQLIFSPFQPLPPSQKYTGKFKR